jgi:hypothetical protein
MARLCALSEDVAPVEGVETPALRSVLYENALPNPKVPKSPVLQAAQRDALVSANKRDLYCELSFLSRGRSWQALFMAWVWKRISDPEWKREPWWFKEAEKRPLWNWIEDWRTEKESRVGDIKTKQIVVGRDGGVG